MSVLEALRKGNPFRKMTGGFVSSRAGCGLNAIPMVSRRKSADRSGRSSIERAAFKMVLATSSGVEVGTEIWLRILPRLRVPKQPRIDRLSRSHGVWVMRQSGGVVAEEVWVQIISGQI